MAITTYSVSISNFVFDILKTISYSNNMLTVWFGHKNYLVKVKVWCHKHGRKLSAHLVQKYPVLLPLKMQKMSQSDILLEISSCFTLTNVETC